MSDDTIKLPEAFLHVEGFPGQRYVGRTMAEARAAAEVRARENPGRTVYLLRVEVVAMCSTADVVWRDAPSSNIEPGPRCAALPACEGPEAGQLCGPSCGLYRAPGDAAPPFVAGAGAPWAVIPLAGVCAHMRSVVAVATAMTRAGATLRRTAADVNLVNNMARAIRHRVVSTTVPGLEPKWTDDGRPTWSWHDAARLPFEDEEA